MSSSSLSVTFPNAPKVSPTFRRLLPVAFEAHRLQQHRFNKAQAAASRPVGSEPLKQNFRVQPAQLNSGISGLNEDVLHIDTVSLPATKTRPAVIVSAQVAKDGRILMASLTPKPAEAGVIALTPVVGGVDTKEAGDARGVFKILRRPSAEAASITAESFHAAQGGEPSRMLRSAVLQAMGRNTAVRDLLAQQAATLSHVHNERDEFPDLKREARLEAAVVGSTKTGTDLQETALVEALRDGKTRLFGFVAREAAERRHAFPNRPYGRGSRGLKLLHELTGMGGFLQKASEDVAAAAQNLSSKNFVAGVLGFEPTDTSPGRLSNDVALSKLDAATAKLARVTATIKELERHVRQEQDDARAAMAERLKNRRKKVEEALEALSQANDAGNRISVNVSDVERWERQQAELASLPPFPETRVHTALSASARLPKEVKDFTTAVLKACRASAARGQSATMPSDTMPKDTVA